MRNTQQETFLKPWDELENVIFTNNISFGTTITDPFWIKTSGDRIYILNGTTITQHNLLGPTWDIGDDINGTSNIGTSQGSFSVLVDDNDPLSVFFNNDESKMYVLGRGTGTLLQYELPTPGDITSIVASPTFGSLTGIAETLHKATFNTTGDSLFVTISTGAIIYEFTLSTPFDVTTFGSPSSSVSVDIFDITFQREGFIMYTANETSSRIEQFTLPAQWDVTNRSSTGKTATFNDIGTIQLRSNGFQLFGTDTNIGLIKRIDFVEAFDLDTASNYLNSLSITATGSRWIRVEDEGNFAFVFDANNDDMLRYDLPDPHNIFSASTIPSQTVNVNVVDTNITGFHFSDDGKILWISGNADDTIYRLLLTSRFDLTTLNTTPDDTFVLTTLNPAGMVWSKDGLHLFLGQFPTAGTRGVYEYAAVTPFSFTGMSTTPTNILLTNTNAVSGLDISPAGHDIYVSMAGTDEIDHYILPNKNLAGVSSTPSEVLDVSPIQTDIRCVQMQEDAKRIYIIGRNPDAANSLDLSRDFNNNLISNLGEDIVANNGDQIVWKL